MDDDKINIDFRKKFNEIKNNPKKLWIGLISLFLILSALIYIAFFCKQITTLSFSDGCNETYINGKLNSSECTFAREAMKKQHSFGMNPDINFSFPNMSLQ
jgi:hypothetical protein